MKNYDYVIRSDRPAPTAGGDEKSWFLYYKWNIEGGAWVPAPEGAEVGDFLWFYVDGELMGAVEILQLMHGPMPFMEAHYDADQALRIEPQAARCISGRHIKGETGLSSMDLVHGPGSDGAGYGYYRFYDRYVAEYGTDDHKKKFGVQ